MPTHYTPGLKWVYPRACGGTDSCHYIFSDNMGLSPRVRGNHLLKGDFVDVCGSIPARAGEPSRVSLGARLRWVYPRACGGTINVALVVPDGPGLSPRVRGNRLRQCRVPYRHRSIPARAGEPRRLCPALSRWGVYPRACGGTPRVKSSSGRYSGLSPRVRGNRPVPQSSFGIRRSIPARAGEPAILPNFLTLLTVYPRACGGTVTGLEATLTGAGLSPRVRGNPSCVGLIREVGGSIPARAGEPGSC